MIGLKNLQILGVTCPPLEGAGGGLASGLRSFHPRPLGTPSKGGQFLLKASAQ